MQRVSVRSDDGSRTLSEACCAASTCHANGTAPAAKQQNPKSKVGMTARCASVILGRETHFKDLDARDRREQRRDELGKLCRSLGNPRRTIEENSDDRTIASRAGLFVVFAGRSTMKRWSPRARMDGKGMWMGGEGGKKRGLGGATGEGRRIGGRGGQWQLAPWMAQMAGREGRSPQGFQKPE